MDQFDEWVSLREFARRVGVNVFAVQQAIENGRIVRREDKQIHWPTQSKAWEEFRDPSKTRDEDDDGEEPSGFQQAKLRREIAVAGLKELELQIAKGEVIKASHAQHAITQFAIDVRESVMSIPERVANEVAAEIALKIPGGANLDLDSLKDIVARLWKRESRMALERIGREAER